MINTPFDLRNELALEAKRREVYYAELAWWERAHRWCYWAGQAVAVGSMFAGFAASWAPWLGCLALLALLRIPYNYCHMRVMQTINAEGARAEAGIAAITELMKELDA